MKVIGKDLRQKKSPRISVRPFCDSLSQTLSYPEFQCAIVDLSFVTDFEMRKINKKYRQINKTTNILAFPQFEWSAPLTPVNDFISQTLPNQPVVLGDVLISIDVVKTEADRNNVHFRDHLILIAIHGILHLLGFNHDTDTAESFMNDEQLKLFQKLCSRFKDSL